MYFLNFNPLGNEGMEDMWEYLFSWWYSVLYVTFSLKEMIIRL